MPSQNTLNVCLGHLPFPQGYSHHIDIMVSPVPMNSPVKFALVEDKLFGPHGSALSEYAQLLWINEHIEALMGDLQFIRIFHYRRFVSPEKPTNGKPSTNHLWSTVITEHELAAYDKAFDRNVSHELFNTPIQCGGGMLAQYAVSHVLEDMMYFCAFLVESKILSAIETAVFLREAIHIPSCNIGVFLKCTYTDIFGALRLASEFLNSRNFVVRDGYQRRNVGFLLERLNSFLILKRIRERTSQEMLGHNLVISDSEIISITN